LPQPEQLPVAATLPNILVTGDTQHLPQSFDQRYASTQVLTRADLDRLSPIDPSITQALATLPGVTISQNGGPGSTLASVSIRGSSGSQVAVFIDGIRVGSATTGQAEWADLPTSAFDRVEVISGPAAASFGADAVGGVVQLFTNRAANQPNQTTISTGGGSNKTFDTQSPHLRQYSVHRSARRHCRTDLFAGLARLQHGGNRCDPALGLTGTRMAAIRTMLRTWMRVSVMRMTTGRSPHSPSITGPICPTTMPAAITGRLDHQLTTGVAFHLDITPFTQFDQSVGYATDRQFLYANNPGHPDRRDRLDALQHVDFADPSGTRSRRSSVCRCPARPSSPTTSPASKPSCRSTSPQACRRATIQLSRCISRSRSVR
jgi:vitamin B12 transporter